MGCRPSLRIGKDLGDDPTLLQVDDSSGEADGPLTKAVERAKKGIPAPVVNPEANGLASADSSAPPAVVAGGATPPGSQEMADTARRRRDSGSGQAGSASASARSPRRPANNGRPGPDYKQLPPGTPSPKSPPPAELQRPESGRASPASTPPSSNHGAHLANPLPALPISNGAKQRTQPSQQAGSEADAHALSNSSGDYTDGKGRIPEAAFSDADVWLPRAYEQKALGLDAAAGAVVKNPAPGRVLDALKKAPAGDMDVSRLKQAVITAVAIELGHDPGGALSDSSGEGTSPRRPVLSPGKGGTGVGTGSWKDPADPVRQLSFVEIPAPQTPPSPQQAQEEQKGGRTPAELFEAAFGADPSQAALMSPVSGDSSDSSAMSPNAKAVLSPKTDGGYWQPHPPHPTAIDEKYPEDDDVNFDPYKEAARIRNAEPVVSPHALHRNAFGGEAGQHPLSDSSDDDPGRSKEVLSDYGGSPRGNPHMPPDFRHPTDADPLECGFASLALPENRTPYADTSNDYVPYTQQAIYDGGFASEDALDVGFDDLDMSRMVHSPTGYTHPGFDQDPAPVDLKDMYRAAFGAGDYGGGGVLSDISEEESPRGPSQRRETTPPSNTPNALEVGFDDLHFLRHESLKERYRRENPGEAHGDVELSSSSSGEDVVKTENPLVRYSAAELAIFDNAEYGYGHTAWQGYAEGPDMNEKLAKIRADERQNRVQDLYEKKIGPDPGTRIQDSSDEEHSPRVAVFHDTSPRPAGYAPTALDVGYADLHPEAYGPRWGAATSEKRSGTSSPSSRRGEPVLSSSPRTPNGPLEYTYNDLEYEKYRDARNQYLTQAGKLADSSDEDADDEDANHAREAVQASPRQDHVVMIDPLDVGYDELKEERKKMWDRSRSSMSKAVEPSTSGGQSQDQQPSAVSASEAAVAKEVACPAGSTSNRSHT